MDQRLYDNHNGGYVTLVTVLALAAIAASLSTAMLLFGTDSTLTSRTVFESASARTLATACAEMALQAIWDDGTYTGTDTISLGTGSCTYTVTNDGGEARTITVSGTEDDVSQSFSITLDQVTSLVNVTAWTET